MGKLNSYLKFLYKSSNQHGVHSPFVYGLLTKGLYVKSPRYKRQRKQKVFLQRVFDYFQVKNVAIVSQKSTPIHLVNLQGVAFNDFKAFQGLYDAIWLTKPCKGQEICIEALIQSMGNDSFIVLDKSKGGSKIQELWYKILKDQRFTVTIDFYYYGLAFIRQEQLKQHFILRM